LPYLQVTSCNHASNHKLQVQTNLNFELEWEVQNLNESWFLNSQFLIAQYLLHSSIHAHSICCMPSVSLSRDCKFVLSFFKVATKSKLQILKFLVFLF
jgi:hypothetical protein